MDDFSILHGRLSICLNASALFAIEAAKIAQRQNCQMISPTQSIEPDARTATHSFGSSAKDAQVFEEQRPSEEKIRGRFVVIVAMEEARMMSSTHIRKVSRRACEVCLP